MSMVLGCGVGALKYWSLLALIYHQNRPPRVLPHHFGRTLGTYSDELSAHVSDCGEETSTSVLDISNSSSTCPHNRSTLWAIIWDYH